MKCQKFTTITNNIKSLNFHWTPEKVGGMEKKSSKFSKMKFCQYIPFPTIEIEQIFKTEILQIFYSQLMKTVHKENSAQISNDI